MLRSSHPHSHPHQNHCSLSINNKKAGLLPPPTDKVFAPHSIPVALSAFVDNTGILNSGTLLWKKVLSGSMSWSPRPHQMVAPGAVPGYSLTSAPPPPNHLPSLQARARSRRH